MRAGLLHIVFIGITFAMTAALLSVSAIADEDAKTPDKIHPGSLPGSDDVSRDGSAEPPAKSEASIEREKTTEKKFEEFLKDPSNGLSGKELYEAIESAKGKKTKDLEDLLNDKERFKKLNKTDKEIVGASWARDFLAHYDESGKKQLDKSELKKKLALADTIQKQAVYNRQSNLGGTKKEEPFRIADAINKRDWAFLALAGVRQRLREDILKFDAKYKDIDFRHQTVPAGTGSDGFRKVNYDFKNAVVLVAKSQDFNGATSGFADHARSQGAHVVEISSMEDLQRVSNALGGSSPKPNLYFFMHGNEGYGANNGDGKIGANFSFHGGNAEEIGKLFKGKINDTIFHSCSLGQSVNALADYALAADSNTHANANVVGASAGGAFMKSGSTQTQIRVRGQNDPVKFLTFAGEDSKDGKLPSYANNPNEDAPSQPIFTGKNPAEKGDGGGGGGGGGSGEGQNNQVAQNPGLGVGGGNGAGGNSGGNQGNKSNGPGAAAPGLTFSAPSFYSPKKPGEVVAIGPTAKKTNPATPPPSSVVSIKPFDTNGAISIVKNNPAPTYSPTRERLILQGTQFGGSRAH